MTKATIKDIARVAGVSAMTVSKALNNKPGVSADRRAEILKIADQLNYSPNLIAKSLRNDETKTIGVILSDSSEMVASRVLRGIQDGADKQDYSVIVVNTDHHAERERAAIRTLVEKQIDGLILVAPVLSSAEDVVALKAYGVPFLFLMRKSDSARIDTVINDNYLGGYQSVEHLVMKGCREFCVLALKNSIRIVEREKGYMQAFQKFKIPENAIHMHYVNPFIQEGYEAICSALNNAEKFDAVICGCDTVAIGAMEALLENNITIPDEVCLIGYDGIDLSKYLRIPLTTIAQPLYEIGRTGIDILLDRIHFPETAIRKEVLKSKLIERASTNRVSKAK